MNFIVLGTRLLLVGVRCKLSGSLVYPVNPDIVNGYCSLAGPTANFSYERYTLVPLVNFKSIRNSHSPWIVTQCNASKPNQNSPVRLPNPVL